MFITLLGYYTLLMGKLFGLSFGFVFPALIAHCSATTLFKILKL